MAERGLTVDHVTIWRWVQRYAPVLNQRIRREIRRRIDPGAWMKPTSRSLGIPVSGRRLRRRDDRVHVVAESGPGRGEAVPAARINAVQRHARE